jgi:allantoicase
VSHNQPIPEPFADLTDLSSDLTGTFVHYATDDYFAEKENLLKPSPPEWREGAYTDRGKWMDGWESQRKRSPGHDHCIIRLGTPGSIEGILCDTTHFKGNAPQEVSLEIAELSDTKADFSDVEWREVIGRTSVKADFPNLLHLVTKSPRATHVRFHIYPDGGVGRLRVYGRVSPAPRLFWQPGSIDLAAVGNGGTIAAVSDQFFGPPSNLLLPGRGVNMGDGWETKRRRTPGSDWCVIKLCRRSVVERVELDTHFFKGNAQATLIEAINPEALTEAGRGGRLARGSRRRPRPASGPPVRAPDASSPPTCATIFSVKSIACVLWARARLCRANHPALTDAMDDMAARELFVSFCGSNAFADRLLARRPFGSVRELFERVDESFWASSQEELLEAFAAHPRIGDKAPAAHQTMQSASWSKGEQAQVEREAGDVLARLKAVNDAYFDKFGFIFIVFASGRSAGEMLAIAEERIDNDRATEVENAAREQLRITRLRLEKWLTSQMG